MPIFEYQCEDCKASFEKLVRRPADSSELTCPECGQPHLTLKLSTFAAHSGPSRGGSSTPMCPSGGVCPTPGACGMN